MAGLEDITVTNREDETGESVSSTNEELSAPTRKNAKRRKRRNVRDLNDSGDGSPPRGGQNVPQRQIPNHNQGSGVDGSGKREQVEQPAVGQKGDLPPTREDYRARFYEIYHKEAEDYDKEFIKKYDEDLNTTLIFAGLFSAVTSAFIIEVNSELKPDPNEETAALLRVLIYKMDNTTFGGSVPAIPQWTAPPHTVVHVQAILFASLAASLFSAFLAMLGKQWLNQYASVDMRGSAIERGQNRQRKLDGIVTWYFDYVMQSLPLMLQVALLLLGCALSRYLWEINMTVASVVIGVTSFGVLFYLFIIIAGAASASCPYQTPGAHILHCTFHEILGTSHSIFSASVKGSICCRVYSNMWTYLKAGPHTVVETTQIPLYIFLLPIFLIWDTYKATRWLLIGFSTWLQQILKPPVAMLDLCCISWTLQTSLDAPVHLAALNYLTMTTLVNVDSTLVAGCFNILFSCIRVIDNKAVITQGMEQLAPATALSCLHTLSHLAFTDPTLRTLGNTGQQYVRAFPHRTDFSTLPFSHTLYLIHGIFHHGTLFGMQWMPQWEDYKPSSDECAIVSHAATKIAWFKYQRGGTLEWLNWLPLFVLHFLSQSPLPSTSVIVDCLSIIAIGLGYDPFSSTISDESALLDELSLLITQKFESMVKDHNQHLSNFERMALSALLPYAIFLEESGQPQMLDAISHTAKARQSMRCKWYHAQPLITAMFKKPNPPSLTWILGLISRNVPWHDGPHDKNMVARQAATVSAALNPEEVHWSVADELLHLAFIDTLESSSIPSGFPVRPKGTGGDITHKVQALGDFEILKSYFLLAWSEWHRVDGRPGGISEMQASIQEEFCGIGMGCHREDLVKQLDHVLDCLECIYNRQQAKEQCKELRRVLLELDEEAVNILTRSHQTFMCAIPLPCL